MNEKIMKALGEELSTQVQEKLKEAGLEVGVINDGTLVPAEKHDSMKAELKANQEQLEKLQKDLQATEGKEQTIEELKQKLQQANTDYETFKQETEKREIINKKKNAAIKALEEAGAIKSSIDLLANTLDLEQLQLDKQGNLVDKDTIINDLKTQREGLFTTVQVDGGKPPAAPSKGDLNDLSDQAFFETMMTKGK